MRMLRRVVVDLTPVLPGGGNGGAKPFSLELVSRLACRRPEVEFVLLTCWKSHDELALLERENLIRHLHIPKQEAGSVDAAIRPDGRSPLRRTIETRIAPAVPERIRTALRGPYERIAQGRNRLLRDLKADLYFCPFTAPASAHPRVPAVSVVHDLQFRAYPHLFLGADLGERNANFRVACRVVRRLVCPSEYVKRTIVESGQAAPGRIVVIPHAMQARLPEVSADASASALQSRGLEPRGYLLYPANFWKHKNHEMLLAAYSLFLRRGKKPAVKLVCTGEPGVRRDELMRLADSMGLAEAIAFPGYVAVEEFAALMRRARALVFPSLYEGFGMPVLEAMREGVPVACSDRTSLPEVAGGAALLFDPRKPEDIADAISRLVEDEALLRELAEKGRARVERLPGADGMAERYWQVFDEVCE